MNERRLHNWLHYATGLGLLLLLSAQEKIFPWVSAPLPVAKDVQPANAGDEGAGESPGRDGPQKPVRMCLPHLLPDAATPRVASQVLLDGARDGGGAWNGVVSCGRPAQDGGAAWALLPLAETGWRRLSTRWGLAKLLRPDDPQVVPTCDGLLLALVPTGPPAC